MTTAHPSTALTPENTFAFGLKDVDELPFPHVMRRPFFQPELFARLKEQFPGNSYFENKDRVGGRTDRDLYSGDAGYQEFLDSAPAWRQVHDFFDSPAFVQFGLGLFGKWLKPLGSEVDPSRAHHVNYIEPRENLARKRSKLTKLLRRVPLASRLVDPRHDVQVNDLFVRLDFEQCDVGYTKKVHCDLPNRLFSMIVYFDDADAIGMVGGDLQIHEHRERKSPLGYERYPHDENTRVVHTVKSQANSGLVFLCCNNSYHSVTPITALKSYRRYIYVSISSVADAW